jgi:hypothetical protein
MANTKIPVELSSTPGIVDNSNATAITIDSSENVGIGGSPSYPFHVTGGGDTVAAVTAGASSIAALNLGNDTNKADGGIRYDNSADALIFRASNAEKMRILSSGGLTFNGDTATANALDDYEEGTWTPVYDSNSGLSSVTGITGATGYYVKVGKFVQINGTFTMNGNSSNYIDDGDNIRITGIPYTPEGPWYSQPGTTYTTNAFSNRGGSWGPAYRYSSYYVIQWVATSGISAAWAGDEANTIYFQQTYKIV